LLRENVFTIKITKMKKNEILATLALISVVLFTSCKKDNATPTPAPVTQPVITIPL